MKQVRKAQQDLRNVNTINLARRWETLNDPSVDSAKNPGPEGVKNLTAVIKKPVGDIATHQIRPYASPKSLSGTSRAGG